MGALDTPGRGEFEDLMRRVRALETQSPLESSSVKNGRVRFIGGTLRVEAGGSVEIVGSLEIDGTTTVTGTFNVNGPWAINGNGTIAGNVTVTGPFTVNGPWALNGDGTIAGNVDLTGDMDVTGDINVNGSGRVNVGTAMRLNPATDGGAVEFNTGLLRSTGVALGIYYSSGSSVVLNSTSATLAGSGCSFVAGSAPRIVSLPTRSSGSSNGAPVGCVWSDTSGNLFRVV